MQIIDVNRLEAAKRAASTRRIDLKAARLLITADSAPTAGDLVLARVDRPGHHDGVEEISGRRASIYAGDEILVCYGNRYAPDQFEAVVPADMSPCHLIAAGGLAGRALTWHSAMRAPTEITPIGIVANQDAVPLNIRTFRIGAATAPVTIPVVLSVGTSMNAGKTTTAARLIRGLTRAGLKVGAAKVTGTSAGKDTWLMRDSGAALVLDFNDAGFATTYKETIEDIEDGTLRQLFTLQSAGCDIAVVEVADGILQQETRLLLERATLKRMTSAVIFSSVDSMGAVAGSRWLMDIGYNVPALAGTFTNSPLASREAAEATGLPVVPLRSFLEPQTVLDILPCANEARVIRQLQDLSNAAVCA